MRLNILFDAIWGNTGHSNIPKCLGRAPACGFLLLGVRAGVRYAANTIEEMQKHLRGYRDNVDLDPRFSMVNVERASSSNHA